MPEKMRNGIPLPLRKKYLSKMYPDLTRGYLELCIRSEQQRKIFCRYYGFECEPQSNDQILTELGIRCPNQVAVQLDRAEVKLGVDKDKKFDLVQALRKEYYKKHRPKCPMCKASRSQYRGGSSSGEQDLWFCAKCKGSFKTDKAEQWDTTRRVSISFVVDAGKTVSYVAGKVDGEKMQAIGGSLQVRVRGEDWKLTL